MEPSADLPLFSLFLGMHGLIFNTSIWLLAGSTSYPPSLKVPALLFCFQNNPFEVTLIPKEFAVLVIGVRCPAFSPSDKQVFSFCSLLSQRHWRTSGTTWSDGLNAVVYFLVAYSLFDFRLTEQWHCSFSFRIDPQVSLFIQMLGLKAFQLKYTFSFDKESVSQSPTIHSLLLIQRDDFNKMVTMQLKWSKLLWRRMIEEHKGVGNLFLFNQDTHRLIVESLFISLIGDSPSSLASVRMVLCFCFHGQHKKPLCSPVFFQWIIPKDQDRTSIGPPKRSFDRGPMAADLGFLRSSVEALPLRSPLGCSVLRRFEPSHNIVFFGHSFAFLSRSVITLIL